MTITHTKTSLLLAQNVIDFMADKKNHKEGDVKSAGSSYVVKKNGIILLYVGRKIVVRFTPTDEGFKKEFTFANATAFKRIMALFHVLEMDSLGLSHPEMARISIEKADGSNINLNTSLPYTYEDLVALNHS